MSPKLCFYDTCQIWIWYRVSKYCFSGAEKWMKKQLNILRPGQDSCHFADIFKCIFLDENVWILLKISLKFILKFQINNIPALVQIMAWHRPGDKPLSQSMMDSFLTCICITRPQWVKNVVTATEDYHQVGLSSKYQQTVLFSESNLHQIQGMVCNANTFMGLEVINCESVYGALIISE